MINYHQSRDYFHCCFRISCILTDSKVTKVEFDKLRILDFYTVFPRLAESITLPQAMRHARKAFQAAPAPYERMPEPTRVFETMFNIQSMAVHAMIGAGILLAEPYSSSGFVQVSQTGGAIANSLVDKFSERKSPWFRAIVEQLIMIELLGPDGLKARTGLAEHRYDLA